MTKEARISLVKIAIACLASLVAGYACTGSLNPPALLGSAVVFFVPCLLLSFMYRGYAGLIPGLLIVAAMAYLFFLECRRLLTHTLRGPLPGTTGPCAKHPELQGSSGWC